MRRGAEGSPQGLSDLLRPNFFEARQVVNARAANDPEYRFGHDPRVNLLSCSAQQSLPNRTGDVKGASLRTCEPYRRVARCSLTPGTDPNGGSSHAGGGRASVLV